LPSKWAFLASLGQKVAGKGDKPVLDFRNGKKKSEIVSNKSEIVSVKSEIISDKSQTESDQCALVGNQCALASDQCHRESDQCYRGTMDADNLSNLLVSP
jgi:hypothetical protein